MNRLTVTDGVSAVALRATRRAESGFAGSASFPPQERQNGAEKDLQTQSADSTAATQKTIKEGSR